MPRPLTRPHAILPTTLLFVAACGQGFVGTGDSSSIDGDGAATSQLYGKKKCEVLPNPVEAGQKIEVRVSGMRASALLRLQIDAPSASHQRDVTSDESGIASVTLMTVSPGAGSVTVALYHSKRGFRNVATCTFQVVEPVVCGDFVCDAGETCETCETDCGTCSPPCGNGVCASDEDCASCEIDCGTCPPLCGDGVCASDEDCASCEIDCGTCSGVTTPVQTGVASSSDDAEENLSSGSVSLTSSDLELAEESTPQLIGMRFRLDVPRHAAIERAFVRFTVDEATSGSALLTIEVQAADNAPAFSASIGNISNRPTVPGSVAWAPADWPVVGASDPAQTTPDLSQLIQEIVDRDGWSAGAHLAVLISGTGTRTAESFDGDPAGAALLELEYTGGDQPPECGDGVCEQPETCRSCQIDCGECNSVIDSQYVGYTNWCKVAVHTHPNRTGGEEMAHAHLIQGYDLVFFTDHSYDPQTAPVNVPGIETVSGEEVSTAEGHCNALGNTAYVEPGMSRQDTIDAAAAVGALLQVNHPSRYGVVPADLDELVGLWGIEIKNAGTNSPEDILLWDSQISQGKRLWGTFSDDAHATDKVGQGWLMVATPSDCSRDQVMTNMVTGNFYSSEGPELTISVDGDTIIVSSDSAVRLDWYKQGMTLVQTTNSAADSFTVDGSEVFVRVVATDGSGKIAMSNPIFLLEGSGPTCGDATCDAAESCDSCPADCGSCGPECGDQICDATESCTSCPGDCGGCGPVCGNGLCEAGEDAASCANDCDTGNVGPERYVDPSHASASDSNPGTADLPWQTLTKAASAAQPGETVWVRAGTYTEGLHVEVSGQPGQRITFAAYPGEQVVLRNRCVEIVGQSHVEVRGFRIEYCDNVGSNDQRGIYVGGIENGPVVRDIIIANNHTYWTYSSGISAWGVPWQHDPGDFRRIVELVIEGNTIERGNEGGYNEQITLANGVEDFEIRYNEIKNGVDPTNGGEGIDIKEGCAYGAIHHNVVHDIQRRAYYIDGSGRLAKSAPTHDIDFYSNVAYNVVNGFAIMSEGGEDVYNIRIFNNLIYDTETDCAFIYDHPNTADSPGQFWNIEFTNNTFWNCGRNGLDLNSDELLSGIMVRNNILSTYRDRFSLAAEDSNMIGGSPEFVDAAGGDFHLQSTSPAIDSGSSVDAPTVDLDDSPRPIGDGFDIGAYEYGAP